MDVKEHSKVFLCELLLELQRVLFRFFPSIADQNLPFQTVKRKISEQSGSKWTFDTHDRLTVEFQHACPNRNENPAEISRTLWELYSLLVRFVDHDILARFLWSIFLIMLSKRDFAERRLLGGL